MPKRGGRSVRAVGRTIAVFESMRREADPICHMSLTAKSRHDAAPRNAAWIAAPANSETPSASAEGHHRSLPRLFLR